MPRRLLAAAVAGTIAVTGLAACRDQPTVAAYVGSAQLTNAQVEKMLGELDADQVNRDPGRYRQLVVSVFVVREVSVRLAREHGITIPAADPSQLSSIAENMHAKPGDIVRLVADETAAATAVEHLGTPQVPTEADQREVFQNLVADQVVPANQYDAVRDQIDSPQMRAALGLRTVLQDALKRYRVSLNPRYEPLTLQVPFTIGNVSTFVGLPIDARPSAVVSGR
jgi:hypothetical protein